MPMSFMGLVACMLLLACGRPARAGAPNPGVDVARAAADRSVQWFPVPVARLTRGGFDGPETAIGSRGVTLEATDVLWLHAAPPEELDALDRAGRLPAPAFLRVDLESAGAAASLRVYRFDPRAPRRTLVLESPALEAGGRRYYAPPPFPGVTAWAVRAAGRISASLSRIRRPRDSWERLEEAARAGTAATTAAAGQLLDFLEGDSHEASELAWRQAAALPWPESADATDAEKLLRRASFFLSALEARAGQVDAMDPEPVDSSLASLATSGTVRLGELEYRELPVSQQATLSVRGPRMLRVATRALYDSAAGEAQRRYELTYTLDGAWRDARTLTTLPDDELAPVARPGRLCYPGRERAAWFLIPPGLHTATLRSDLPVLVRFDLERERQGVGDSALEDAEGALEACLAATASPGGQPAAVVARLLVIRAAALALLARPAAAAAAARLACEVRKTQDPALAAWSRLLTAGELAARRDFAPAVEELARASKELEASVRSESPSTALVARSLAREACRRRARLFAATGRYEQAVAALDPVLRRHPGDADTRLEQARLASVVPQSPTSRPASWPQADLAWLQSRLDPSARLELSRLWSESSVWRQMAPVVALHGPQRVLRLRSAPILPRREAAGGPLLPFRSASAAPQLFELGSGPGWIGATRARVLVPATPAALAPFPLEVVVESGEPSPPRVLVDGRALSGSREAGRWHFTSAVRPGLRELEIDRDRAFCNFPTLEIADGWSAGRAPLNPWTLETCAAVGAEGIVFAPTPGPARGALSLLASPAATAGAATLLLEVEGEPPREVVLAPGGSAGDGFAHEAALLLPPGAGRIRVSQKDGPPCAAQLSERLARSGWQAPPPPAPDLSPKEGARQFCAPLAPALRRHVEIALGLELFDPERTAGADPSELIETLEAMTDEVSRVERSPAIVRVARARVLERLDNHRLAHAEYRAVLADEPAAGPAARLAAEGVVRELAIAGDRRESLEAASTLIRSGQDHLPLRLNMARTLLELGEERDAFDLLSPLAGLSGAERSEAPALLAQALSLLGRDGEARAAAARGTTVRAQYARAVLDAKLGKLQEAELALRALAARVGGPLGRAAARRAFELALVGRARRTESSELALARATWFERSDSDRWEAPRAWELGSHGYRARHYEDARPLLSSSYRVAPDEPLLLRVEGPAQLRLTFRADCPAGGLGRGAADWRVEVDGRPVLAESVQDVAPSAEVSMPEVRGAVPGEAQTRLVAIGNGWHELRVTGHAFAVRPALRVPAFDDLLAPGGPLPAAGTRSDGAVLQAWDAARAGAWNEAASALAAAAGPLGARAALLDAEVRLALGDVPGARARLAGLPEALDDDAARMAADLWRALGERDAPGMAGPGWDDLMRALAAYERQLERSAWDEELQSGRAAVLERLGWNDASGFDSSAGSETAVIAGEREAVSPSARVRRAQEYSPWGRGQALVVSRERVELELDSAGPVGVRVALHARRPARGREPQPARTATVTVRVGVDGRAPLEWKVPLNRTVVRMLPVLTAGGHVLELALDDPDGRASAAVRLELDRTVRLERGQLLLGERTPGRWHELPVRGLRGYRVATRARPVQVTVRGPLVARLMLRAVGVAAAGKRGAPPAVSVSLDGAAQTVPLPGGSDASAQLLERPEARLTPEVAHLLMLPLPKSYRLSVRPSGAFEALARLELPVPRAFERKGCAVERVSTSAFPLARGSREPARQLLGPMAELTRARRHSAGTARYRVRYQEGLRPEIDDFRLERHVDTGVYWFHRRADRPITTAWEADTRWRVDGPTAQVVGFRYYREAPRDNGPRASASARLIGQEVRGRAEATLRAQASYGRPEDIGPRLRHSPEASLEIFASTLSSTRGEAPAQVDSELFTNFDRDHSRALSLEDTLTWTPHTDSQLFARGRAVTNESLLPHDIDRVSLRLGTRQLRGPLELETHYTRTERFADDHRKRAVHDDDLGLELSFWRWLREGRFLSAAASLLYRDRFGEWLSGLSVHLTADRGRRFDDLPPGYTSFESAKEAAVPGDL